MTYRERRARRAERLRGWADKRQQNAAAVFKQGERYRGDHAFNTQPGHIPERARLIAREDRAHQSIAKADSMNSRADEIDRQAGRAIYNDDPDAIEQLRERIALLETQRERIKAINKAVRAHGLQRLIQPDPPFVLTDAEKAEFLQLMKLCPYHQVEKRGLPSYTLQNLGGNLTRQRQRLAVLLARQTATDEARPRCERGELAEPEALLMNLADMAATLNQSAPLLADPPPFTLTPTPSDDGAHQQSLLPVPDAPVKG